MEVQNNDAGIGAASVSKSDDAAPIDRAWIPLIGACLCMFCGVPGVVYYSFGIFLPRILENTGWSPAGVAAAIGPGVFAGALAAPLTGRFSDRFGVRLVALVGGPAFAAGVTLLGLFSSSSITFAALTILMYLFAFAGTPIAYAQMLTGWFERRRGLALGVMFCAAALGIAIWPAYAELLIDRFGWRSAYVILGWSAGIVIFACGVFLLRDAPESRVSDVAVHGAPGLTAGEALRTSRFWRIAVTFAIVSAVFGGGAVQFPLLLKHLGTDTGIAAGVLSVIGVAMFLGRFVLGFVLDRWFAPRATIAVIVVGAAAVPLLLMGTERPMILGAAFCLGFGLGSEYAVIAYLVSCAFGLRAYGAIYGLMTLATTVGMAAGPASIGVALVTGVAPASLFLVALVLLALAIALLLTLKRSDLAFAVVKPEE